MFVLRTRPYHASQQEQPSVVVKQRDQRPGSNTVERCMPQRIEVLKIHH